MIKIISEMPVGITMEFAGGNPAHSDISGFTTASFLAPGDTYLGSELGDVFVIFEVGPKFYLGTRLFV